MPGQINPALTTEPGYVRLRCDNPPAVIYCLVGDESPHYTNGSFGWEVTGRPKQIGMTTWTGVEPLQYMLPIVLDGFAIWNRRPDRFIEPVQPDVESLLNIAQGSGESQPGLLQIDGLPEVDPRMDWFIENLEFGAALRSRTNFAVGRQAVTLTLRQYLSPRASLVSAPRVPTGDPKGKTAIIKVKAGDTPSTIARRRGCDWKDLRKLNPSIVKRANQKLKGGTPLRVPAVKRKKK